MLVVVAVGQVLGAAAEQQNPLLEEVKNPLTSVKIGNPFSPLVRCPVVVATAAAALLGCLCPPRPPCRCRPNALVLQPAARGGGHVGCHHLGCSSVQKVQQY